MDMDIISLPIEYDKERIDGRFRLVNIAAQRAKELALGAEPKIQSKAEKITTLAIQEVVANKVDFLVGEEAAKAIEQSKKLAFRKLLEERRRELDAEERSELEKDLSVFMQEKEESITADELFDSEE
ncbi:MAG: DNA-directed RNA polymerase subunit omega [Nitrospirae bacterium]|nr:MAG: DNA-directed RNA polymerase subunit omega [Nitrospirota bacterium]